MALPDILKADHLNAWWDALVRGNDHPPQSADPALVATIRRLPSLDEAPAPDPAFAARLRQQLLERAVRPQPAEATRSRVTPLAWSRRWWAAGAAVLALALVVTGAFWAMRAGPGRPDAGRDAIASYVQPEVLPDLTALVAASDLVVRGRAVGPSAIAVEQAILNRAAVDPAALRLELIQLPPDAPALLNDPPLEAGEEYILFLRSFWGLSSEQFRNGDRTFRPVGGVQGQWPIRDGRVLQQGDVPLRARSGEAVDGFVAEVAAAPDPRAVAADLLARYGWAPGQPDTVRLQAVSGADALERDPDLRRWLAASRAVGLDFAPNAGHDALWLRYVFNVPGASGASVTVLIADGRAVGAWVRAGEHGLVFQLDEREQALAAAADPSIRPTPTPDPHPIGERPNLAQHYRLAETAGMWIKGPVVQGGVVRDDALRARLIAAFDATTAVERVAAAPADDLQTVLLVFATGTGETGVAFRYHLDEQRVYEPSEGIAFAPPPALVEALAPLLEAPPVPEPTAAPPGEFRPTEAPA